MAWTKELFSDIGELIKKLTPKEAFIALMSIIFLVAFIGGGLLFYKEYNKKQIIMMRISRGQFQAHPQESNEKSLGPINEAGFIKTTSKIVKAMAPK
jgi:hypothetical protein